MDTSGAPVPKPEPFKELLADQGRLRILLSVAFDYAWEMTPEGPDNLRIHMLQDPSVDLGLPPGEFRRTLTALALAGPAGASSDSHGIRRDRADCPDGEQVRRRRECQRGGRS